MADSDHSWLTLEEITIVSDESANFASDRSGFSSFGNSTASSLLSAYDEFFHQLDMLQKPPSSNGVVANGLEPYEQRLSEFETAYPFHEKYGSFRPLYLTVKGVNMLSFKHPMVTENKTVYFVTQGKKVHSFNYYNTLFIIIFKL